MSTTYNHLDLSKLSYRKHRTISTEESLKDITPIWWSEDVLNGEKKVIIDKYGIHEISSLDKTHEISYD